MRIFALATLLVIASISGANAWWSYAQWGLSESALLSASSGRAMPCRPDVPVCAAPSGGIAPSLFVDGITMIGMPASASFAFDGQRGLVQTLVLFPNAEPALLSSLLLGIHGKPVEDPSTTPPTQTWRDERKGTIITIAPVGQGGRLLYRPAT
jgi:hypothetical protein